MKKLSVLAFFVCLISSAHLWAGTCSYGGIDCKTNNDCPQFTKCVGGNAYYDCGPEKKCPTSSLVKQQLQCVNGLCMDPNVQNFKGYPSACNTENVCLGADKKPLMKH